MRNLISRSNAKVKRINEIQRRLSISNKSETNWFCNKTYLNNLKFETFTDEKSKSVNVNVNAKRELTNKELKRDVEINYLNKFDLDPNYGPSVGTHS